MIKIALIQMRIEPGAKPDNLRRAAQFIRDAAQAGAQIALLPEAMPIGWTDERSALLADPIPHGESCRLLRHLAAEHRLLLCAGLVERAVDDKIYNSAVLIGLDGQILLHHRKIYELDIAHAQYALGDRLAVADTPLGRIGVMICADGFAPGQAVSRTLGLMGADLILSPCAWAVSAGHDNTAGPYGQLWLDNYSPVARNYQMWIAGVSNVGPILNGPWAGRKCIGASLVVGPDGTKAVQLPYGENAETMQLLEITLVPRPARGTGWESHWQAK